MQVEGLNIDINKLPVEAKKEFLRYKIKLEEKRKESAIKNDFMSFVKYVWPDFIEGSHHKIMSEKFNKVATPGVMIRIAPPSRPRPGLPPAL